MAEYEYVAVCIGIGRANSEDKITERIGSVAAHGWHLVSTLNGDSHYLIFEREAQ